MFRIYNFGTLYLNQLLTELSEIYCDVSAQPVEHSIKISSKSINKKPRYRTFRLFQKYVLVKKPLKLMQIFYWFVLFLIVFLLISIDQWLAVLTWT